MSVTLTGLIPIMYEGLDIVSRELIGFSRALSMDSSAETAAVGQVVRSHVSTEVETEDIVPGVTPPNTGDGDFDVVDVVITKSKSAPIKWTGEEQLSVNQSVNRMMADQFAQSVRALANEIEGDIFDGFYPSLSRVYGTPGVTPFATAGDLSDIAETRRILDDNGSPQSDLHMILGSGAIANIRGKQSGLFEVNRAGTDELLRLGAIANIEGFDIHNSRAVKKITKGAAAGYVLSGAHDPGAVSLSLATGTGDFRPGDLITLAGTDDIYVVESWNSGTSILMINKPGIVADNPIGDGTALTVLESAVRNIAMCRSAGVLALRAPAMPKTPDGRPADMALDMTTIVDPNSGLSFQVAMYAMYRQVRFEVAAAWGVKAVKPEHMVGLIG